MAAADHASNEPAQRRPTVTWAGDFYLEDGCVVFTAAHHLRRGSCCGSGCRHCPFEPRHETGSTRVTPPGGQA